MRRHNVATSFMRICISIGSKDEVDGVVVMQNTTKHNCARSPRKPVRVQLFQSLWQVWAPFTIIYTACAASLAPMFNGYNSILQEDMATSRQVMCFLWRVNILHKDSSSQPDSTSSSASCLSPGTHMVEAPSLLLEQFSHSRDQRTTHK